MNGNRNDEQHEDARFGNRLIGDSIKERTEGRDCGKRQRHLHGEWQIQRRRPPHERGNDARNARPQQQSTRRARYLPPLDTRVELKNTRNDGHSDQQTYRARRFTEAPR